MQFVAVVVTVKVAIALARSRHALSVGVAEEGVWRAGNDVCRAKKVLP